MSAPKPLSACREVESLGPDRDGALVMVGDDARSCPAHSPKGWRCSLIPGHEGRHVAMCDDEQGRLNVVSTWDADAAPKAESGKR